MADPRLPAGHVRRRGSHVVPPRRRARPQGFQSSGADVRGRCAGRSGGSVMTITERDTISLGIRLTDLDEDARYDRFAELQRRMPEVWADMRRDHDDESVVVVPSVSLDGAVAHSGVVMQAMEERA